MLLWMLEELSSTQGTGLRVLSTSGCSGLWGAGANAVARTGCVHQGHKHTFSLQRLPMALSLLDLAHRPFALTDPAQRGVAVVLCGSAQAAAPLHPSATVHCAPGLLPAFLQLHLLGQGSTDLARCRCALGRGGFALLSAPACNSCPFPTAQAPGSAGALGFSGPRAALKQTQQPFPLLESP